jgi:hypothetical protein
MMKQYEQNITHLINLPKKKLYDKNTKHAIGQLDGDDIFTTEFLIAKQFGYIDKFQGHKELKDYLKLLPYISKYYEKKYLDTKSKRIIYIIDDNDNRKIFHIIDEDNYLVSVHLVRIKELKRFLKRAELLITNPNGEAPISPILSPARAAFWRHLDLI